jgi:putative tricarboxylic transport membrane protein
VRELAAPLAFLAVSGLYLATSLTFPLGSAARPGAGFFPAGVGAYLCALAVVLLVASWRRVPAHAREAASDAISADARARVIATIAALVGFCATLGWIGYPAAAFLFTAVLLKSLGGGQWTRVILAALLAAAASYYLFGVLLGVPLPRGVWGG